MLFHLPKELELERRSNRVRLQTLTTLRWIAIVGQITSIFVAWWLFDIKVNVGGFAVVIGSSILVNAVSTFVYPTSTRLTEKQTALLFLFDITQLSSLLFLSGGMNNPFAMLMLAPVSVAALALRPAFATTLGAIAILQVSFIANFNFSLVTNDGAILTLPDVSLFGVWIAVVIGVIFVGVFSWRISSEIESVSEALLATQMALSREQKLTDIGGVVAAAAHELGTPLATIKLVSSELVEELSDQKILKEDAELIRAQADRCAEIMRSMGQAGKDDLHMKFAPIQGVVEEAATPHLNRGKTVLFEILEEAEQELLPFVRRQPEMIHGLRNLIQNAVDFSVSAVWVDIWWNEKIVGVRIVDDGPGFPSSIKGRIGDPFVRHRRSDKNKAARPGYDGMGLGLFIAKTLLERTGAQFSFFNGNDEVLTDSTAGKRLGAIVELIWERDKICIEEGEQNKALGENSILKI